MQRQSPLPVILFGALIVVIAMGTRQSFGLFLQPISDALDIGRERYSLAIALQNIVFGLPLMGLLADRHGPRTILFGGSILYAGGLTIVALFPTTMALFLSMGILVGLGLSSISYVVVLGAVAQRVPPEKRSWAFGLITAAGSFGMFAMIFPAQWLLSRFEWQIAFYGLALFVLATALFSFGLPNRPPDATEPAPDSLESPTLRSALLKAKNNGSYWLLFSGFFVCGFHVAFVSTHLPSFLTDNGISQATGATALSLIGIFNIIGSYTFGWLGDRYRKKYLLSFLYAARALVIGIFLFLPLSQTTALLFGAAIGFLWLATVPLTSGTVAQIFGSRYLSSLYGIVFFGHQLGAFLGVWLGGNIYDSTGSYTLVWWLAIGLGIAAALIHLPITDRPLARVAPA